MNRKQFFLIVFVALVLAGFNFFRAYPMGVDSYAFINSFCLKNPLPAGTPLISKAFFSIFPCQPLLFKALSFFLMFFTALGVGYLGEIFNKKHGWMAGLFVFMFPGFGLEFAKLEDDVLAFPLLMLANYFFVKGIIEQDFKKKIIGIGFVFLAFSIWAGSAVYFFSYALNSLLAFLIAGSILIYLGWEKILLLFIPLVSKLKEYPFWKIKFVYENLPGIGFTQWFFGAMGLMAVPKKLWLLAGFWVVAGLLNGKMAFHAIPFLSIGFMCLFARAYENRNKALQIALLLVFVGSVIGVGHSILNNPPQPYHFEAIDYAIGLADDENIMLWNDWGYGYWVQSRGGDPSGTGGDWVIREIGGNQVLLINEEFNSPLSHCVFRQEWKEISVWLCSS